MWNKMAIQSDNQATYSDQLHYVFWLYDQILNSQ